MQRSIWALIVLAALTVQGQQNKPSATVPLPIPKNVPTEPPKVSPPDEFEKRQAHQTVLSPEGEAAVRKLAQEAIAKEKAIAADTSRSREERFKALVKLNQETDAKMRLLLPESLFLEWQNENTFLESAYLAGVTLREPPYKRTK